MLLTGSLKLVLESTNWSPPVYTSQTRLSGETMEIFGEGEGNRRGLVSRLVSAIYLVMYVICCLSFDVSIVTPLNDAKVYSELSRIQGVTGNVIAE